MKHEQHKFIKWVKYNFDNLMSKGTSAPLFLLLGGSFIFLIILSGLLLITGILTPEIVANGKVNGDVNFFDAIYITLLRMLDPGVVSGDPIIWPFLTFMLVATLGGMLLFSVLIAIVNSGVINKLTDLRKGKSFVLETNHTIILGWSFQVFPIVNELVIANENLKRASIAILAEKDKIQMEDEISSKVKNLKTTKVVCRTGSPIDLMDLEILNIHEARSIIIIAPETKDPDSIVIKTILAITNNPNRRPDTKYHIVAEIRDPRNVAIAEIAGRDEVQLVIFDYLISRITAQTCRQPGLSVVFNELLDFSGDEIYFQEVPELVGKTFIEAMFSFEDSILIGIRKKNSEILLKPAHDTKIESGDILIAISEDDDTIKLSGKKEFNINTDAIRKNPEYVDPSPETTLIIGWNRRAHLIINELDNYVHPGSRITVIAENVSAENDLSLHCADLKNQTVTFWFGDTTNRRILDDLNIETYDHIIVLSQTENSNIQASDARTLSTLLHLRDIADTRGHQFSIVSEMLDDRNRELAEITHTDDFIVSVKLDSLMLSQISENAELKRIFEDLFSAGGPSIYIKPAEYYVELGRAVNFYTIMESARQQGHLAIGIKLKNNDTSFKKSEMLAHGVVVNPNKSREIFFSKGDKIIILSEDEITSVIG